MFCEMLGTEAKEKTDELPRVSWLMEYSRSSTFWNT
jgi:hypothetical protein